MSTEPEPSSGKVLPANCASTILLISVKGRSIGTAILTPPFDAGPMVSVAGNGQSGLVSAGVMRVSASRPIVSVIAEESTRGCAAIARVGFSSSHSGGRPEPLVPCRGIERQALAHCARAFCSKVGSFFIRACAAASCSATCLSMTGLTCAGTLMRAPPALRLVSPRLTCAARLGSMRQAAANFGRDVTTTLPLISPETLRFLMLMPPSCLAALAPSRPPMASLTASFAFADSEPVTLSVPVSGVVSDSTSCAPVTVIDPREAVQPISAFCRICDTGFSALPPKVRAVPRSAASRIAVSEIETSASTREERVAGGSGGSSASTGALPPLRDDRKSMAFRLIKKETATTAAAIRTVLRLRSNFSRLRPSFKRLRSSFRRIVPPESAGFYKGVEAGARPAWKQGLSQHRNKNGAAGAPFCFHRMLKRSAALVVCVVGAAVHRQHDHLGADVNARVQIHHVLVGQTQAAGRHASADGVRRVG